MTVLKKRFLILFCSFVLILTLLSPFLPVNGESGIYSNTVRLHILANSDSEEDQALKLLVRDAILEKAEDIFSEYKTKDEAEEAFSRALPDIRAIAERVVAENGYDYKVSVTLGEEYYPEKEYEDLRYPAGYYTSLIVGIGNAEGKNWWCVLFPPLCLSSAKKDERLAEAGFTPNQVRVLNEGEEPKYVVRFKILEWAESVFDFFRRR